MPITAIALTIFYLALLNFFVHSFRWLQLSHFKPWVSLALFNAKFLAGILLWAVYTFYYTDTANSDIHKFYNDALILRNVADENVAAFTKLMLGREDSTTATYTAAMKNWERNFDEAPINENRTIIRLNAVLMFLSFRTYFVHILFMCFISFVGWVLLFNGVFSNLQNKANALLALPALFLPSVLFWTSGVMKEPVLILGLGIFVYGLVSFPAIRAVVLVALGSILILASKFYVLACAAPAALAFVLSKYFKSKGGIVNVYAVVFLLLGITAFNIQHVMPDINPSRMLINKQQHSIKEAEYFNAGSRIALPRLTEEPGGIITKTTDGIWNCLSRPYLWESKNAMMLLSALEAVLIWAILLLSLWLGNPKQGGYQVNLILFLLAFSVSYFALIGISTPVLGNLVRYKAPLLPLFVFACILPAQVKTPALLKRAFLNQAD